jgi:AGCS family alanine or glycine:cation symporter
MERMDFHYLLTFFNHYFTFYIIFPLVILIGTYLSIRLKFIQFTQLKLSFLSLIDKNKEAKGSISRFEAIASVLAGNFGTGNISGMAIALTTGGPGALVWMWIMVFFASIIQLASTYLGAYYRIQNSQGEFVGGPMYYLKKGIKSPVLACLFSTFTIFGALTVGNLAQVSSIILPLEKAGFNSFYCSLLLSFFVAIVILGGLKRFASLAAMIVPFKAGLYLLTALVILVINHDKLLLSIQIMFEDAFNFSSFLGGLGGGFAFKTLTTGFDRGLFATDAGTGIVPILQAGARSQNPLIDGISTLIAPLLVMIVCTVTGLVLIVTGIYQDVTLKSTNMVTHAFKMGLNSEIGSYIVIICIILFAYTTLLAWSYCGEKAIEFLLGSKSVKIFRFLFISFIPLSSFLHIDLIWTLSDIAITLMLFINLIAITFLSNEVIIAFKNFKHPCLVNKILDTEELLQKK